MGNPTGFINVGRALPTERHAGDRLIDWLEVYEEIPQKEVEKQASRCMDCGVPFCQSAKSEFAPVVAGCPVNNVIPEWNDLIYRGRWKMLFSYYIKQITFLNLQAVYVQHLVKVLVYSVSMRTL